MILRIITVSRTFQLAADVRLALFIVSSTSTSPHNLKLVNLSAIVDYKKNNLCTSSKFQPKQQTKFGLNVSSYGK